MNKLLTKVAKLVLGLSLAAGVGVAVGTGSKASRADAAAGDSPIIIDATNLGLTSTATTGDTNKTYGGVTYVVSAGAKLQSSSGVNKFSTDTILIGKSGAYIYNSTAIPGTITKFEVYQNKGASSKVSVGVKFATSKITSWNATGAWTATLSTLDHVYDASSAIVSNATYFRYQVTNANNSQIAFRITYSSSSGPTQLIAPSPTYNSANQEVTWSPVANASSYQVSVDNESSYATATSPYDVSSLAVGTHTVYVKAIGDGTNYTTSPAGHVEFTIEAPFESKTYELIKSTSDLEVGAHYLIGSGTDGSVAFISNTQNSNNRGATNLTVSDEEVDSTSSVEIVQLGGSSGAWTFLTTRSTSNGYLYAASSSSNYLRTQSSNDTNGQWAITIENTGAATVVAQGSNTHNILKYNGSNNPPIFSCYTTSGSVYLYKEVVQEDPNKVLTNSLLVTGALDDGAKSLVEGQVFTPTGLTIYAVYTDSTTYPNEDVTSLISWSALEVGDTSVTGSYTHGEVTATCTISGITVAAKTLSSISLAGASGGSGNNQFMARQAFNINGVTITAHFNNGTTATVEHNDVNLAIELDDVDITSGHVFTDAEASNTAENHTIKISYTYSGVTKHSSYKISVTPYTNPIAAIYSKSSGAAVDVYGVYVGFLDGTGPVIMDGDYGVVVYNKTLDVSGYTEKSTVLHVTGSVSIYNGLYEIGSPTVSLATGSYTAPDTPVLYATQGGETAEYASRITTVTGVATVTSGSLDSNAGTSDIKFNFNLGGSNNVQVFYKKAAQTADATTYADMKAAVSAGTEVTVGGFTSWYNGFQVQMTHVVEADESYTAEIFAQDLLDQTDDVCENYDGVTNNHTALAAIWTDLAGDDKYPSLPSDQKTILAEASRNESGTVVERAMARYDYLTGKYNLSNFINGRTPVQFSNQLLLANYVNENTNTITIVVIISLISVTAIGGFFFIRKRKVN